MKKPARPPQRDLASRVGVPILRGLRSIPIVRERVIPWLVRAELDQIPVAPVVAAMRRELEALSKSRGPVLVGPWLSEVGFELLYWIPFLEWATAEFGIDRKRLIAVSRGGATSWYANVCDEYVDLFDLFTVDEYRQRNQQRWEVAGNQKHYEIVEFDRDVATRVSERLGVTGARFLHPSTMYRLLRFFWYEKAPVSLLTRHTKYRSMRPPTLPTLNLPSRYIVVRFYFRPSFPDTAENRRFANDLVTRLAADRPVVLLNPGLVLDDHFDHEPDAARGIVRIEHLMTPSTNLHVQSAVIAGAEAFVGTYGGLSYLGPYYRVPTVAFYSNPAELVPAHLDVAWRLCRQTDSSLAMMSVTEAGLVGEFIGSAARASGAVSR